jgi:pimeloyl-ACP methyl ester carboxylesterase
MKPLLRFVVVFGILTAIFSPGSAWAEENSWSAHFRFTVELRPGVVADIDTIYMLNLHHQSGGKTLLAVPGMGLTANSYQPLVEQLFAAGSHGESSLFSGAILMDFPGHGGSGLPRNDPSTAPLLFGNLTLQDYVTTLLGVLDQLAFLQIQPDMLVGHCMGGMIIQLAQQQLIAQNTDVHRRYGIKDVVLIATDPPGQIQGSRTDPSAFNLAPFVVPNDPVLGTYLKLKLRPQFILNNWFRNLAGVYVPGAPMNYMTDPSPIADESMMVLLEIFGRPPFTNRPMIEAGIFDSKHGSCLSLIAFSQDAFYSPEGQLATYKYLTGDRTGGIYSNGRYDFIDAPDAVHGMYYSNPAALIGTGKDFH